MMKKIKVGIIGGGLSGLTAAKKLHSQGIEFEVLEQSDRVGGKLKTDVRDGHRLDHGFQVLLNSYPQVKKNLDINRLDCRYFSSGATVYRAPGDSFQIVDPMREPSKLIQMMSSDIGTLRDKLLTMKLKIQTESDIAQDTVSFLREYGFSEKMIEQFFIPFFSGVFLDKRLEVPSDYFLFLFKMFGNGLAGLPKQGMESIPIQLTESYQGSIKVNCRVKEIIDKGEKIEVKVDGCDKVLNYDVIIMACDANTVNRLLPQLSYDGEYRSVVTLYYTSKTPSPFGKDLILNSSGKGKVNHLAYLTAVQPDYAPDNNQLISVNILSTESPDPKEVWEELKSWHILPADDWSFLDSWKIKYALPKRFGQKSKEINNMQGKLIMAGDFTQTPSIEGAMQSGELAANQVINRFS
jgi:phytoene dehydrogenase-like protein